MVFGFNIELLRVPRLLQGGAAREVVAREFKRAMNESVIFVKSRMIAASPLGVAGGSGLRGSWQSTRAREIAPFVFEGLVVAVGSWAALVLEGGAKPHFPPVGGPGTTPALGAWIRKKLGISDPAKVRRAALGISRKFKAQGRPALHLFSKTLVAATPLVRRAMQRAMQRVAARIG